MKRTLLLSLALTLFTCAYAAVGDTFVLDNVTYIVKSDNTVGIKKADSKVTSFNLTDQVTNEAPPTPWYRLRTTRSSILKPQPSPFHQPSPQLVTAHSQVVRPLPSSCQRTSRLSATTHSTQCATSPLLRFLKAWRLSAPTSIQAHSALAML